MIVFHFALLSISGVYGFYRGPSTAPHVVSLNFEVPFDGENVYAKGTPMERPKIGNTILDTIGATPMVLLTSMIVYI
jgi:hypothetical protein